tara:strand:+ start:228 stop:455 length:228 start_codon:yes stop_codon:yes gene_type:complete
MSDQKKSTDQSSFDKYDYIRIPKEESEIIFEELAMLSRSKFLDEEDQQTIIDAMEEIQWLTKKSLTRIVKEEVNK